jgi:hypothetical protein
LQILATSFSPKTRAKMRERRKMGEMGRERRNLGIVTVAKELVRNEEGRGLIYTWRARATPLGSLPSVTSQARVMISKEGGALLGLGFWYGVVG